MMPFGNSARAAPGAFPELLRRFWKQYPPGKASLSGNSLAIRAFDGVRCPFPKSLDIISNRGVSGIEGNMATSVGYAEASGRRVTAVIGDISFLHDLNSLIMVRQSLVPVIIVVVNNGGGRIFECLPIRDFPEIMEPWMTTPHTMNFSGNSRLNSTFPTRRSQGPMNLSRRTDRARADGPLGHFGDCFVAGG